MSSTKTFIGNVIYMICLIDMNTLLYFKRKRKPVFDLKIKHIFSVHGCGDKQFCGAWIFI